MCNCLKVKQILYSKALLFIWNRLISLSLLFRWSKSQQQKFIITTFFYFLLLSQFGLVVIHCLLSRNSSSIICNNVIFFRFVKIYTDRPSLTNVLVQWNLQPPRQLIMGPYKIRRWCVNMDSKLHLYIWGL